jgi:hypothetical protein
MFENILKGKIMDIPIEVEVLCGVQVGGRSTYLVINPVTDEVTHLVVAEKDFPNTEHLVPVEQIVESSPTSIRLRCSPEELSRMTNFIKMDFIDSGKFVAEGDLPADAHFLFWPYGSTGLSEPIPRLYGVEYKRIPPGEVVIRRGAQVKATDGTVGKVDEFLVNRENDQITHVVMREGHFWSPKEVTIPVSEIEKIDDEVVYLKIDRKTIASLPAIPVDRRWK